MKLIKLTRGLFTKVDDDDFEVLNSVKWQARASSPNVYYAGNSKYPLMHRFLMNAPANREVDHINGDKLDNRKSNLRLCTRSQNAMNKSKYCGEGAYIGVHFTKRTGKYEAYIKWKTRKLHLGHFKTPQEAALARNKKALELYGEFAKLNEVK